ncbi:MAG: histidine triad nucleotide-binding protein [bacterium]
MSQAECIFCKIIDGSLPSTKVYEDDQSLAFLDANPKAPVHFLVIPKQHIESLPSTTSESEVLLGHLLGVAREVAKKKGISETGYKIIQNVGQDGGQVVPHLHFHILGGRQVTGAV